MLPYELAERQLDGTIGVRFRDRYLKVTLCAARPEPRQIETAARTVYFAQGQAA